MCTEILQLVKERATALNPAAAKTAMKVLFESHFAELQISGVFKDNHEII